MRCGVFESRIAAWSYWALNQSPPTTPRAWQTALPQTATFCWPASIGAATYSRSSSNSSEGAEARVRVGLRTISVPRRISCGARQRRTEGRLRSGVNPSSPRRSAPSSKGAYVDAPNPRRVYRTRGNWLLAWERTRRTRALCFRHPQEG